MSSTTRTAFLKWHDECYKPKPATCEQWGHYFIRLTIMTTVTVFIFVVVVGGVLLTPNSAGVERQSSSYCIDHES